MIKTGIAIAGMVGLSLLVGSASGAEHASGSMVHKAGLWKVTRTSDRSPDAVIVKVCIRGNDGDLLYLVGAILPRGQCQRQTSGDDKRATITSQCISVKNSRINTNLVVTRSGETDFHVNMTEDYTTETAARQTKSSADFRYLGACAPSAKSGDITFENGGTVNIHDMQVLLPLESALDE